MSEWKKVKLGDLGAIITGKTPPTRDRDNYGGNIPFITPVDMMGNRTVFNTERYVSEKGKISVKNCIIPACSICVSCIGSDMGKSVITSKPSITNQQINSIIVNEQYYWLFVFYLMRTMEQTIKSLGKNATAVPILNKSKFSSIDVLVPSFSTQYCIATNLSRYDTLIENYQKQIKLLEEAAQRLYKEWFVDLRFPGYENAKMVDGLPEGWAKRKLVDVAKLKAGGDKPEAFSNEKTEELTVPVFSNGTVNEGLYGYTNIAEVNEPSVTISARGSIGFTVMRRVPYVPIVRLISIIPIDVYVGYLYFFIKGMPLDGNGAAQQQITVPMVKNKEIIIPTHLILKAFEKEAEPLFIMVENLKNQIRFLAEARDRLLPRLMGGEMEVDAPKGQRATSIEQRSGHNEQTTNAPKGQKH